MKTLLLIRHAKSAWDDPSQSDHDRPLNNRGKRDAPRMGERLKERLTPDAFLSSTARRARKTAEAFAEAFGKGKEDVLLLDKLYHATPAVFESAVSEADNGWNTIAVFSHNNGITDYANSLTPVRIDNMPTAAVFAVEADVDNWQDFAAAEKRFLFFDYPKAILD